MWRNRHHRNIAVMTGVAVILVCCTALYEFRYTLWGIPYDWPEIQAKGTLRIAAIEGDTVFVRQILRFSEAANLSVDVKYCSHEDELWLSLVTLESDLVHFPNDDGEYSWRTRKNCPALQDTMDLWYDRNVRHISKWDGYFHQYADSIGWDWKMLAAICFVETRFRNVNSATGLGVMQLSRHTASVFGAKGNSVFNPHYNIKAAANYIAYLDDYFSMVKLRSERRKFVIAAYNSGEGSVRRAMEKTRTHKKNECEWESVEKYFRNNHSKKYLKKTLSKYEEYCIKE